MRGLLRNHPPHRRRETSADDSETVTISAASSEKSSLIDALRGGAALLVVASHLRALFLVPYGERPQDLFTTVVQLPLALGHEAVMIFFVLSGYWVGGGAIRAMAGNRFRWGRYLIARLTRMWLVLAPALLLTLVLDVAGTLLAPRAAVYSGKAPYDFLVPPGVKDRHDVGVALGNLAFQQSIRLPVFGSNGPLWSLAYEWGYYVLFPILMMVVGRGLRWRRRWLYVGLALLVGVILGKSVILLLPVWSLGPLAYKLGARLHTTMPAGGQLLAGTLIVVMLGLSKWIGPSWLSDFCLAISVAVFLLTIHRGVRLHRAIRRPVLLLAKLAPISFSLYAIHFPILVLLAALIVPSPTDRYPVSGQALAVLSALVLMVVGLAWVFAQLTERHTEAVRDWIAAALIDPSRNQRFPRLRRRGPDAS